MINTTIKDCCLSQQPSSPNISFSTCNSTFIPSSRSYSLAAMPIQKYGCWVAYPKSFTAETDENTPHIELMFGEDRNSSVGNFRAAINIKSSTPNESRLVYWFERDLRKHTISDELAALGPGFHPRGSNKFPALDYIRGNLFSLQTGTILRHNVPGEMNDITDYMSPVLTEAIQRKATIYLFGQQFDSGDDGIHDVHMNQGNSGKYAKDNGVWQDGGILLYFPDDQHWEGIFLAFAVQIVHTDDRTGNPIGTTSFVELLGGDAPPPPISDGTVYIRAALVNPVGPDENPQGQPETVYLVNKTQQDINLANWSIRNRNNDSQNLSGVLKSNGQIKVEVPNCPLSNKGGIITLLNAAGLKVDGVSYSKAQAAREGVLIYFH